MASNAKNLAELLNTDTTVAVADVADGSITTAKLADDAVTSAKLGASSVDATALASNAVTTAKVADGAVTQSKTTGVGAGKNSIINGAMTIAQRATSASGLGADGGYYKTIDRMHYTTSGTAGRFTMSQDSDAPSGFANSLKLDCTTADTSIAAGELFLLSTHLEGQDLQHFAKGTSDAKAFALSFYVKGNANATYVAELYDHDNNRQVSKLFNVTTSWTRIELDMGADTTGAFDDNNAISLTVQFWLHSGSNYTGGTLNTSWNSVTQTNRAPGISSFFDSTNRTFYVTGMKLEPVQVTDYEHETFAVARQRCERYYQTGYHRDLKFGKDTGSGYCQAWSILDLREPMRATPTVTRSANSSLGTLAHENYITLQTWTVNSGNTHVSLNFEWQADAEL
tara:strand:- start:181 stop:1371 length:1191 start_codon:yes stop_codon:yes gene_type:complete